MWRSADLHIPSRLFFFFFFFATQLSSLRNEVCCAEILFPVHSPSCPVCQYLKTKHFSSASHPRLKLPSHYSHSTHKSPFLFTRERTGSSSWSQKIRNLLSHHSSATHWADPQPKWTFSWNRSGWCRLWSESDTFWGFRGYPWEREARSPNSLSDSLT